MTLYDRLGGEAVLAPVVEDFYSRMTADGLLAPWFVSANHDHILLHLRAYLAVALGGPEAYSGRSMRTAHGGLHITAEAFDTALARLADSLTATGVETDLIEAVLRVVSTLRPVVVQVGR